MWNNRKRNSISSHKAKLKWSSRSFGDVFGSFSLISIKVCLRFFEGWNIPQMGLSKARLFRKGTYGGGHVELPKDLTRFWSGWLWNPRSSTILVNSSMVSGGCSLAYLWRSDLVYGSAISTRSLWQLELLKKKWCGVLKVAAPKLKVFPMSKCCCIHDDIYWRWPTLTTLKPFFKIDCGTQQLQKSIPSKLKMCIWKGLLESKVIWSLVAVSQGQKVNHLFLVNKSMNSNRTSYAMRAWLVWKTQCSCPSYFKSASQVLLLHFLSATEMKGRDFEFKSSFDHMLPHCPQTPSLGSARRPSGILSRRGLEYCCFRSTSRSKGMPLLEKTLTQGHDDIFLEAFSGKSMFKVFAFSTKNDVCSHWGDLHVMHNIFSLYVTIPHDPWLVTQR